MDNIDTLLISTAVVIGIANLIVLLRGSQIFTFMRGDKRVILDTCALIDGRIVEIARAGFVPSQLLVPRPVIRELQFMADQADPAKRERARFGLDVIGELQQMRGVNVQVIARDSKELVDEQLISLAKQFGAQLYTTDYNLNKVAQVEGVNVLNVNELAQAIRSRFLPGENVSVKLVQPGQSAHQGVGYLDDGTMVVVENAKQFIGEHVDVVFTRVIQTHAGKMMFATLKKSVDGRSGAYRGNSKKNDGDKRRRSARVKPLIK